MCRPCSCSESIKLLLWSVQPHQIVVLACLCCSTAAAAQTLPPPKHLCSLEQDVLQEVSRAVVGIVLKPTARVNPDAHCGCLRVGVGLGSNSQAIWQSSHLQPRTPRDEYRPFCLKAPAAELPCSCIVISLTTVCICSPVLTLLQAQQLHLQHTVVSKALYHELLHLAYLTCVSGIVDSSGV